MLATVRTSTLSASILALSVTGAIAQTTETFSFTGTIGSWTAPQTGEYRIVAIGAQGASADPSYSGGLGAKVEGTFELSAGDMFQVLVGGAGIAGGSNGGGGGGTFFVSSENIPFLIAGGGGGTRASVLQNGTDASITEAAFTASGSEQSYTPALKTSDVGMGGAVSSASWGSGGGGFFGAGEADICGTAAGGGNWAGGMEGGNIAGTSGAGGFGGGGSGDGCAGGGGGGGYSGGDGGRVAGGGGSYNMGTDPNAFAGAGFGDGLLQIIYLLILGPTSDEEIARLTAAASVMGRVVVFDAREVSRMNGRESLASRDASIPLSGSTKTEQSSIAGNVHTWVELTGFRADDDGERAYTGRGIQMGADVALTPDMVAGLSLGIHDLSANANDFSQEGNFRFIQPYFAYRTGSWSGEASLIYGHGNYNQSSTGGIGEGETRLKALSFTGGYDYTIDSGVTLTPMIGLTRGVESTEGTSGTLDGAGIEKVRFSEVSLGSELTQRIAGGEIIAGFYADWLNSSSDTELVSDFLVDDGLTGRVKLEMTTEVFDGLELDTSIEVSGLGGDLKQASSSLRFAFRF